MASYSKGEGTEKSEDLPVRRLPHPRLRRWLWKSRIHILPVQRFARNTHPVLRRSCCMFTNGYKTPVNLHVSSARFLLMLLLVTRYACLPIFRAPDMVDGVPALANVGDKICRTPWTYSRSSISPQQKEWGCRKRRPPRRELYPKNILFLVDACALRRGEIKL